MLMGCILGILARSFIHPQRRAPSARAAVDAGMTENNFPPISQQRWAFSYLG
jgi:hypothetical protein